MTVIFNNGETRNGCNSTTFTEERSPESHLITFIYAHFLPGPKFHTCVNKYAYVVFFFFFFKHLIARLILFNWKLIKAPSFLQWLREVLAFNFVKAPI